MSKFFLKYYLHIVSFIVPMLILLLSYAIREVYPFGESSILILDLYHQYIFYYEAFYNIFYEGSGFFYSFSRSLGGEMMGLYAYYLASPFSFLLLIFPRVLMIEATLFMILAKVGAAGLTFYIFLKNSRNANDLFAIMFSTMYALMSYVIIHTMNPMFLDGVILLPIVILGLENLINKGQYGLFIVSLSILFISNFYIGYMTGIFIFFYFLYYLLGKTKNISKEIFFKKTKTFFFSTVLSLGLSMWILLPTYFSLQMGKIGFTEPNFTPQEQLNFFDLFSKMLPFTYDTVNVEGLPFIFSGTIVLILFFGYFLSKQISSKAKIASASFLALIFIAFSVSTVDIALHGFQNPNWLNYRYAFILSFFLLVISYEFFINIFKEEKNVIFKAFIIPIIIVILISNFDYPYLKAEVNIWFAYILLVIYLIFLSYIKKFPQKQILSFLLVFIVLVEMFFNTYLLLNYIDDELHYAKRSQYREHLDKFLPLVEEIKANDSTFYRMENIQRLSTNDPFALMFNGLSHSSSTLNQNLLDLLFEFGYFSTSHWSQYSGGTIVSDSLLGIKYVLGGGLRHDKYLYSKLDSGSVYENPYAMPIAFPVNESLKNIELSRSNPFINQNFILSSMLGQPYTEYLKPLEIQDIHFENLADDYMFYGDFISYNYDIEPSPETYVEYVLPGAEDSPIYMYIDSTYPRSSDLFKNGAYLKHYSVASGDRFYVVLLGTHQQEETFTLKMKPTEETFHIDNHLFYYLDVELFESAIKKLSEPKSEVEKIKDTHLVANVESVGGEILFTSIPFDKGWKAYVNGQETETFKTLNSLLAIEIEEGMNEIELKFLPQGFALGATISLSSLSLLIFLYLKNRKHVNRTKDTF